MSAPTLALANIPAARQGAQSVRLALLLMFSAGLAAPARAALPDAAPTPALAAPAAQGKKAIGHDVYANWRSIQGSVLSRDGNWAAYALAAQEADGEVVVRHLKDGREWRYPRGTAPAFSADGSYLAFAVQPAWAELEQAKKDKKKGEDLPKPGVGIMDLASGKAETLERVKRYAWPEEGGNFLAVQLEAPKEKNKDQKENAGAARPQQDESADQAAAADAGKKKTAGTELLVIDAAGGKRSSYRDVGEFVWSKNGALLAYSVAVPAKDAAKAGAPSKADDAGRAGVYLWNQADASVRTVLSGAGNYRHLQFDEAGRQLAFVSNRDDLAQKRQAAQQIEESPKDSSGKDAAKNAEKEPGVYQLFYWRAGDSTATVAAGAATAGMPEGWGVSEHAAPGFSKDGQRLFFGTAELPKPEPKDVAEAVKVDLWHWKDPELQSMQKVRAEKEKQRSYQAVLHLGEQRMVQLARKDLPQVVVNENAHYALGSSDLPYRMLQSWDALYRDAYAVDLQTGQARLLAQKLRFAPSLSPAGKYVLAFDAASSAWLAWACADGKKIALSGKLHAHFEDRKRDTPEPRSAYGYAGWSADDASVVLYDQFDLWEVQPLTQESRNLTAGFGRKRRLELRYVALDNDKKTVRDEKDEEALPQADGKALPSGPWILAATHDDDRSTGYYRQDRQGGAPEKLIHADKLISGLQKARLADTVLFTQQSFSEFPDLWRSDLGLQAPQKISAANPQQAQYNWGRQELISYTSADGKKLKALLARPENFDPSKKYPLMVYIYENMSDNLHKYIAPAPGQNINVTRYLSNGYIVLRPDIVYRTGHPGQSAYNAVIPAVQTVIAQGYVDPQRVGIQGHSWGAYQINYLLTRTAMFRAAEAGASMANMVSGYGGIRWGSGLSRAFQYEKQQSRIGGAPWNKTAAYIENSPIFHIDKVQTPYLTIHNDEDDAVPWYQAIEFFTALRQLGKEAYWFNYNGEKHGLKERDHMKHYTVHMAEFFDHYLLDSPRPQWMEQPVPYLERGKRDVMGQFKAAAQ
ncbi:MAG: S9 family peptidase [Burkholderiales bacterium]|nr:S9 family peptidase [Burkholderiales bacterium]